MEKTIDINSRLFIIYSIRIIVNQEYLIFAKLYLFSIITKKSRKFSTKRDCLSAKQNNYFQPSLLDFGKDFVLLQLDKK